ncbi:MAG TPA: S26 family signal peptidase [Candidatus Limnocylindrales bacterium]
MNETPEESPPAFPFSESAETSRRPQEASGQLPRASRRGLPKLHATWLRARRGTWRVAVAEESMNPALAAGDWLLLDPTCDRWPRHGSIVVFHEPETGILAVKRVAARPGDRVRIAAGTLHLGPDEAWLLGDSAAVSLDSRRYGPVPLDALLGRAWFRYGPTASRIGRLTRRG